MGESPHVSSILLSFYPHHSHQRKVMVSIEVILGCPVSIHTKSHLFCLPRTLTHHLLCSLATVCYAWYWGGDEGRGDDVGVDQEVPAVTDQAVIDVSAGSRHSFIIDPNGDAFVSGFIETFYSYYGHFGVDVDRLSQGPNNFTRVDVVVDLDGRFVQSPKFVKVYAGAGAPGDSRDMHSVLIDEEGNVYTTGNNYVGQSCFDDLKERYVFQRVKLPSPAVAAAVGLDFTLILLENGRVYGCGSNRNGELGLGDDVPFTRRPPTVLTGLRNIQEISSGLNFGLYLERGTGTVFGSGSNLFSQLCESTNGDPVLDYMVSLSNVVLEYTLCLFGTSAIFTLGSVSHKLTLGKYLNRCLM